MSPERRASIISRLAEAELDIQLIRKCMELEEMPLPIIMPKDVLEFGHQTLLKTSVSLDIAATELSRELHSIMSANNGSG